MAKSLVWRAPLVMAFVTSAAWLGCGGSGDDTSAGSPTGAGATGGAAGAGGTATSAGHAGTTSGSSGHAGTTGASGHAGTSGGVGGHAGTSNGGASAMSAGGQSTTSAGGSGTAGTGNGGSSAAGTNAGGTDVGGQSAGGSSSGGAPSAVGPASVLQHHNSPRRTGQYVDPAFTKAAAASLSQVTAFSPPSSGQVYAQTLYVDDPGGHDSVLVFTEDNHVSALDPADGTMRWDKLLAAPMNSGDLPCGNITPHVGVTGTPYIDGATGTLYVDAMTNDNGGAVHQIFALSVADGTVLPGWPVRLDSVKTPVPFDSSTQGERGAIIVVDGTLYVPYGGLWGDCGSYHGWVVAVDTTDPTKVTTWATTAAAGGIWATGGLASDGTDVFAVSGNTMGASVWGGGEAVLKFQPGLAFSSATTDFFVPSNWLKLDQGDTDMSGSGPMLLDVAGSTPSALVMALGKDGNAYLLDRGDMGGIGATPLDKKKVSPNQIIQAATSYTTQMGTYVVFEGKGQSCPAGQSGSHTALRIVPGSPPSIETAWCADAHGRGSPIVTTPDGQGDFVVWALGAGGDNKLHGFDGDTGADVSNGGTAAVTGTSHNFLTPIVAKGKMFFANDTQAWAFAP